MLGQQGHILQFSAEIAIAFGRRGYGATQEKAVVRSPFVQRGRERMSFGQPQHLTPVDPKQRGELSVEASRVRILTKSLRPLPEKWHGLQDLETRYRQRYVDLIANPQVADVFRPGSTALSMRKVAERALEHDDPEARAVAGHLLRSLERSPALRRRR